MAPLAPKYTNFEGGTRADETRFFDHIFPKSALKRLFSGLFFLYLACGAEILAKTGSFCGVRTKDTIPKAPMTKDTIPKDPLYKNRPYHKIPCQLNRSHEL